MSCADKGTKGSHFVWRKYIESFSDSSGKVYITDVNSGLVRHDSTEVTGKKNNIYTLKNKITDFDLYVFCKIFEVDKNSTDSFVQDDLKILKELVGYLNNDFSWLLDNPLLWERVKFDVLAQFDPRALERRQELIFTYYENKFSGVYEKLLNKNTSFYNNKLADHDNLILGFRAGRNLHTSNFFHGMGQKALLGIIKDDNLKKEVVKYFRGLMKVSCSNLETDFPFSSDEFTDIYFFLNYICVQYFRTKQYFDKFNAVANRFNEKNSTKLTANVLPSLFVHYKPFHMAHKIINKKFGASIIEAVGDAKFITSDQPVVNTYGKKGKTTYCNDELELYFPLSPSLALIISDRDAVKKSPLSAADDRLVAYYNGLITDLCDTYVYSLDRKS